MIRSKKNTVNVENCHSQQTSKFFYTNDNFFDSLDDASIWKYVIETFPEFKLDEKDQLKKQKNILNFLENSKLVIQVLEKYNINIGEFLIIIYRMNNELFKKSFINKIQDAIKYKKYAKNLVPKSKPKKSSSKKIKKVSKTKENGKPKAKRKQSKFLKW